MASWQLLYTARSAGPSSWPRRTRKNDPRVNAEIRAATTGPDEAPTHISRREFDLRTVRLAPRATLDRSAITDDDVTGSWAA